MAKKKAEAFGEIPPTAEQMHDDLIDSLMSILSSYSRHFDLESRLRTRLGEEPRLLAEPISDADPAPDQ
jgi:hypothetical protein